MKNLKKEAFLLEAGMQVPEHRDMSAYNGKLFQCACGREHEFASYLKYVNFGTTGMNAKMIVSCPTEPAFATLIKTKYRFLFMFDRFISLAGCKTT
jgi:hypothetical protein